MQQLQANPTVYPVCTVWHQQSLTALSVKGIVYIRHVAAECKCHSFWSCYILQITDLCHLTDGTYKPKQVLKMEQFILKTLDFDLCMPGPIVFLDRFLQVNPCDKNQLVSIKSMWQQVSIKLI